MYGLVMPSFLKPPPYVTYYGNFGYHSINPRPIAALLKVLQLIFYIGSLYIYSTRFRMMYKLRWFENADHGIIFFVNFFLYKNNNKKTVGLITVVQKRRNRFKIEKFLKYKTEKTVGLITAVH